jgi:hypothetical protein
MTVRMRSRYGPVYLLPAVLALAGPLVPVAATRGGFLPFALGWWGLTLIVASIGNRKVRMVVSLLLIPTCVLFVFEGGLFILPAIVSMFLIDVASGLARPSATTPRHAAH